jgi:hypothetical protein
MKKVTVITSIYKGMEFMQGFMEDIVCQTAFDECEWFLLDGSPDDEYSIIKPFLTHENIRYEKIDPDPGLYECWNYMVENSDSPYLTNANIDDRLFPECIEKHIKALDENLDTDVAYCDNIVTFEPNDSFKNYDEDTPIVVFREGGGLFYKSNMIAHNYPHNHPMWRRSLHDRFGLFDTQYVSASDYEFWLRCLAEGANDFFFVPEVLGIYYQNPEGVSTVWDDSEHVQTRTRQEMEIKFRYAEAIAGIDKQNDVAATIERLVEAGRISEKNFLKLSTAINNHDENNIFKNVFK